MKLAYKHSKLWIVEIMSEWGVTQMQDIIPIVLEILKSLQLEPMKLLEEEKGKREENIMMKKTSWYYMLIS